MVWYVYKQRQPRLNTTNQTKIVLKLGKKYMLFALLQRLHKINLMPMGGKLKKKKRRSYLFNFIEFFSFIIFKSNAAKNSLLYLS